MDGLYDAFYVFLAALQKYLAENREAAKYPSRVSYEEMLAYFRNAEDAAVTEFWRRYSEFGYIDLTFEGCAERIGEIERLLQSAVDDYLQRGFTVQRTKKSAAIRLLVPILDFHLPFDSQIENIRSCFAAVRRMNDLVKAFDPAVISALLRFV